MRYENNKLFKDVIKRNKTGNAVFVVVGPTNKGKSYWSLSVAYGMDDGFDIDRVFFRIPDLMRFITDVGDRKVQRDKKVGPFAVFDDAGVKYGRKRWASSFNQSLGVMLQSFRVFRTNLIFTIPDELLLDKGPESVMAYYVIMQRLGVGKVYKIKFGHFDKVTYKKTFCEYEIPFPPKDLVDAYEVKKAKFLLGEYKELIEVMEAEERTEKLKLQQRTRSFGEWVDWIRDHADDMDPKTGKPLLRDVKGEINTGMFMYAMKIEDRGYAYTIVSTVRNRYPGVFKSGDGAKAKNTPEG
jgi:hypothetical protein